MPYGTGANLRNYYYKGFKYASASVVGSDPGFMFWSGSKTLSDPDENYVTQYEGIGAEFIADSESYFRYKIGTAGYGAPGLFVRTPTFYFGGPGQYISGSNGNIEIRSDDFHLQNDGSIVMQGTITATAGGTIGSWEIGSHFLSSSNGAVMLDATGQYPISSSGFRVENNGSVHAYLGFIGGWTLGTSTLVGGNITLNSAGTIEVGSLQDATTVATTNQGAYFDGTAGDILLKGAQNNTDYIKISTAGITIDASTFDLDAGTLILDSAGVGHMRLGTAGGPSDITSTTKGIYLDGNGNFLVYTDANNYIRNTYDGKLNLSSEEFDLDTGTIVIKSNPGYIAMGSTPPTNLTDGKGIFLSASGEFTFGTGSAVNTGAGPGGTRLQWDNKNLEIYSTWAEAGNGLVPIASFGEDNQIAGFGIRYDKIFAPGGGVAMSESFGFMVGQKHYGAGSHLNRVDLFSQSYGYGLQVIDHNEKKVVQLGSTNQIASWSFTENHLTSNLGVGSLESPSIRLLANGTITTVPFASGESGNATGWRIDSQGSAEFQNAKIRGAISTVSFEKETVSCVGGQILIANAAVTQDSASKYLDYPYCTTSPGGIPLVFDGTTTPYLTTGSEWDAGFSVSNPLFMRAMYSGSWDLPGSCSLTASVSYEEDLWWKISSPQNVASEPVPYDSGSDLRIRITPGTGTNNEVTSAGSSYRLTFYIKPGTAGLPKIRVQKPFDSFMTVKINNTAYDAGDVNGWYSQASTNYVNNPSSKEGLNTIIISENAGAGTGLPIVVNLSSPTTESDKHWYINDIHSMHMTQSVKVDSSVGWTVNEIITAKSTLLQPDEYGSVFTREYMRVNGLDEGVPAKPASASLDHHSSDIFTDEGCRFLITASEGHYTFSGSLTPPTDEPEIRRYYFTRVNTGQTNPLTETLNNLVDKINEVQSDVFAEITSSVDSSFQGQFTAVRLLAVGATASEASDWGYRSGSNNSVFDGHVPKVAPTLNVERNLDAYVEGNKLGKFITRVPDGQTLASQGVSGKGFIMMNANPNDTATPYIDVVERTDDLFGAQVNIGNDVDSAFGNTTIAARFGDLSGITDNDFEDGVTGYGLYTKTGYFKGNIYVGSNPQLPHRVDLVHHYKFEGVSGSNNIIELGVLNWELSNVNSQMLAGFSGSMASLTDGISSTVGLSVRNSIYTASQGHMSFHNGMESMSAGGLDEYTKYSWRFGPGVDHNHGRQIQALVEDFGLGASNFAYGGANPPGPGSASVAFWFRVDGWPSAATTEYDRKSIGFLYSRSMDSMQSDSSAFYNPGSLPWNNWVRINERTIELMPGTSNNLYSLSHDFGLNGSGVNPIPAPNAWHHGCLVFGNTGIKWYLDGIYRGKMPWQSSTEIFEFTGIGGMFPQNNGDTNHTSGKTNSDDEQWVNFTASYDDIRSYGIELTTQQIQAIFYANSEAGGGTTVSGDQIRTGAIESNTYLPATGSRFNLHTGDFNLGGSTTPMLSFDSATNTLKLSGSLQIIAGHGIPGEDIEFSNAFPYFSLEVDPSNYTFTASDDEEPSSGSEFLNVKVYAQNLNHNIEWHDFEYSFQNPAMKGFGYKISSQQFGNIHFGKLFGHDGYSGSPWYGGGPPSDGWVSNQYQGTGEISQSLIFAEQFSWEERWGDITPQNYTDLGLSTTFGDNKVWHGTGLGGQHEALPLTITVNRHAPSPAPNYAHSDGFGKVERTIFNHNDFWSSHMRPIGYDSVIAEATFLDSNAIPTSGSGNLGGVHIAYATRSNAFGEGGNQTITYWQGNSKNYGPNSSMSFGVNSGSGALSTHKSYVHSHWPWENGAYGAIGRLDVGTKYKVIFEVSKSYSTALSSGAGEAKLYIPAGTSSAEDVVIWTEASGGTDPDNDWPTTKAETRFYGFFTATNTTMSIHCNWNQAAIDGNPTVCLSKVYIYRVTQTISKTIGELITQGAQGPAGPSLDWLTGSLADLGTGGFNAGLIGTSEVLGFTTGVPVGTVPSLVNFSSFFDSSGNFWLGSSSIDSAGNATYHDSSLSWSPNAGRLILSGSGVHLNTTTMSVSSSGYHLNSIEARLSLGNDKIILSGSSVPQIKLDGGEISSSFFHVDAQGRMSASSGTIGGWEIGPTFLSSSNGAVMLDATGEYPISSSAFRINSLGHITSSNAFFSKDVIARAFRHKTYRVIDYMDVGPADLNYSWWWLGTQISTYGGVHRSQFTGQTHNNIVTQFGNYRAISYYGDGRINYLGEFGDPGQYSHKMTSHLILDCDHNLISTAMTNTINGRSVYINKVVGPPLESGESVPITLEVVDGREVHFVWDDDSPEFDWSVYNNNTGGGTQFNNDFQEFQDDK